MLIILCLPSVLLRVVLRSLGYSVGKRVKIGFSIILVNNFDLGDDAKIGHFNLFSINNINLKNNTLIKHFNIFKGPFSLKMDNKSKITNQNYLVRGKKGVTYGDSTFSIGYNSNITSNHFIDLTKNVSLGSNTVLGGRHSQIWTHGYVHKPTGNDRFRVDGEVKIKNNVYIGSNCFINPGVTISDAVSVGGGTSVARDLLEKGLYVNQGLRYIKYDYEETKARLQKVDASGLVEEVYFKN